MELFPAASAAVGAVYIQEFPHPCVEIQPGSTMEILIPTPGAKKGETVWIRKGYDWADGWFAGGMSGNGDVEADVVRHR